jgi:hypothetical protein
MKYLYRGELSQTAEILGDIANLTLIFEPNQRDIILSRLTHCFGISQMEADRTRNQVIFEQSPDTVAGS